MKAAYPERRPRQRSKIGVFIARNLLQPWTEQKGGTQQSAVKKSKQILATYNEKLFTRFPPSICQKCSHRHNQILPELFKLVFKLFLLMARIIASDGGNLVLFAKLLTSSVSLRDRNCEDKKWGQLRQVTKKLRNAWNLLDVLKTLNVNLILKCKEQKTLDLI